MRDVVFLLGRPGCGKTAAYGTIAAELGKVGLRAERVDDFPYLRRVALEEDPACLRHAPADVGEFRITDPTVYQDALRALARDLGRPAEPGLVTFVEFARGSYAEALKAFEGVLGRAVIVYVCCPFERCWMRIVARAVGFGPGALDKHAVPWSKMVDMYKEDDFEKLLLDSREALERAAPCPVVVIDNSAEGLDNLRREAERAADELLKIIGLPSGVLGR